MVEQCIWTSCLKRICCVKEFLHPNLFKSINLVINYEICLKNGDLLVDTFNISIHRLNNDEHNFELDDSSNNLYFKITDE